MLHDDATVHKAGKIAPIIQESNFVVYSKVILLIVQNFNKFLLVSITKEKLQVNPMKTFVQTRKKTSFYKRVQTIN